MTFNDLKLNDSLLKAVAAEGYTSPTPIQVQAIPHVLAGSDLLGCAQTGTGKTAAFALPILQRLGAPPATGIRPVRCLVLAPTRELASQIDQSFAAYGKNTGLRSTVVFGGVGQEPQVQALKRGVDILVATPGRLLDLMNQRKVSFTSLSVLVLDEADRMLDMGFIHDVKRILAVLPKQRQTLFFSATMPQEVDALAKQMLQKPVRVEVTPVATTAEKVEQRIYMVAKSDKRDLLVHLLKDAGLKRALVFTRTKSGANRVAKHLNGSHILSDVIHGNKSQNARERALAAFKRGEIRVLVATDIAARGIDIDEITHVINFDIPNIPESYVHRIGRTGRAAASGMALSFCDHEERVFLRDIERTIRMQVPVVGDHPFVGGANRPSPAEPREGRDERPARARPPQSRHRRPQQGRGSSSGSGSGGGSRAPSGASPSAPRSSAPAQPAPQERRAPKWF